VDWATGAAPSLGAVIEKGGRVMLLHNAEPVVLGGMTPAPLTQRSASATWPCWRLGHKQRQEGARAHPSPSSQRPRTQMRRMRVK